MKRAVWAALLATLAFATIANADYVSAIDLFLDPWSVPSANYERIVLSTTLSGSGADYNDLSGNSCTWTIDDLSAVSVLPLLNPFSASDPAGYSTGYNFYDKYSVGDYSDYYYTPDVDYRVDVSGSTVTATFNGPGIYYVNIDRDGTDNDIVYAVLVDSGMLQDNGDGDTGASVRINGPVADLIVVSDPTDGDEVLDNAAENAEDDNPGKVERAGSAWEAIEAIRLASEAAGGKIHVEIVAHGSPGHLTIGDSGIGDRDDDDMTIEEFQQEIDNYVDHLSVYACSFARGASGDAALQTLADSIGYASGFTVPVSVYRGWWWDENEGWKLESGWDLQLGGELHESIVPLPTPLLLAGLGMALLGMKRLLHH